MPASHELAHVRAPHPRVVRIRPGRSEEPLGRAIALLRRHLDHRSSQLVQRVRRRVAGDHRVEIGDALVPRALEALEVEGERPVERGAAQEERRVRAEVSQNRRREGRMTGEIVVEGDRDGEPLAAPARRDRLEQAIRRNHVVVADDVPELTLEQPRFVRRDELARWVARTPIHTVIHERDAGLATRQPE